MGVYQDNSPMVVARLTFTYDIPAYINFNGARPAGLYGITSKGEVMVPQANAAYLVNNPKYEYKWISIRPEEFYENEVFIALVYEGIATNIPITRVNLTTKEGKVFSVMALLTRNITSVYCDPTDKFYGTTCKAPFEVLTCVAKGVKKDFAVTTPKYKQKQLCCE
jgi:hypothetical protein